MELGSYTGILHKAERWLGFQVQLMLQQGGSYYIDGGSRVVRGPH